MSDNRPYANEDLEGMRDEFDNGHVEVDDTEPQRVVDGEPSGSGRSAVMSVRLPVSAIAQLKQAAEKQDVGATVLARRLIIAGLADIERNLPREVHLLLTVAHSQVLDAHIDDPAAAIGDNPVEIELEPIEADHGARR
jgi:hypothetical protein